jgi:hypothetical protein
MARGSGCKADAHAQTRGSATSAALLDDIMLDEIAALRDSVDPENTYDSYCGDVSELVADMLTSRGIEATAIEGGAGFDSSHAYVILADGTIVDPTLDQFFKGGRGNWGDDNGWDNNPFFGQVAVFAPDDPYAQHYYTHRDPPSNDGFEHGRIWVEGNEPAWWRALHGTAERDWPSREEMETVAPILLRWVNQDDLVTDWEAALTPHCSTLNKLIPAEPVVLYRNERVNAEWDGFDPATQYSRPSAWSLDREISDDYGSEAHRRLVCATVDPSDILCSIPLAQEAAERVGLAHITDSERIDWLRQEELIVGPQPQLRDYTVLHEPMPDQPVTDPRLIRKPRTDLV